MCQTQTGYKRISQGSKGNETQDLFLLSFPAGATSRKRLRNSPVQNPTRTTCCHSSSGTAGDKSEEKQSLNLAISKRGPNDVLAPNEPHTFQQQRSERRDWLYTHSQHVISHEIAVTNKGSSDHNLVLAALGEKGDGRRGTTGGSLFTVPVQHL